MQICTRAGGVQLRIVYSLLAVGLLLPSRDIGNFFEDAVAAEEHK